MSLDELILSLSDEEAEWASCLDSRNFYAWYAERQES